MSRYSEGCREEQKTGVVDYCGLVIETAVKLVPFTSGSPGSYMPVSLVRILGLEKPITEE